MVKNKNTRILFEVLPDGRPLIEINIREGEAEKILALLVGIFEGQLVDETLESMRHFGKKTNREAEVKGIIDGFLSVEEGETVNNDPLIWPDEVFKRFHQRLNNESD